MTRKASKGSKRKKQKTGLNRNLLDVGIKNLISLIKYKLDEAEGLFIEVPTQKVAPSQTCPNCGKKEKKELSERVHNCECGCKLDRDVAAAQVMLNYVRASGTSVRVEWRGSLYFQTYKKLWRLEASGLDEAKETPNER